jgi:hypothetical protein
MFLVHYSYQPYPPAGGLPYQTATRLLRVVSGRRYGRSGRLLTEFRTIIGDEQVGKLLRTIYRPQMDTNRSVLWRKSWT